jgi:hypothetical protein
MLPAERITSFVAVRRNRVGPGGYMKVKFARCVFNRPECGLSSSRIVTTLQNACDQGIQHDVQIRTRQVSRCEVGCCGTAPRAVFDRRLDPSWKII